MVRTSVGSRLRFSPLHVLFFLVLLALAGCGDGLDFRVVEVLMENAEEDDEGFMTLGSWPMTFAPMEDGGSSRIPVPGHAHVVAEHWGISVPVFPSDGSRLVFSDGGHVILLAGVPVALGLEDGEDEDEGWNWLAGATLEEKTSLRVLYVEGPVTPDQLALLEDLSLYNPNPELITEDPDLLLELLGLFDPVALPFIDTPFPPGAYPLLAGEAELKRIWLDGSDLADLGFLEQVPGLEEVFLFDWDPKETGALPDSMPELRSILVGGFEGDDLGALGRQPGLEELILAWCDGDPFSDLQALAGSTDLKILSFRGCEVAELGPLVPFENLRWLGLPEGTTQAELEQVVLALPELEFLELLELDDVTDLSPLLRLQNLKGLMLDSTAPPDPLFEMEQLEYLALSVDSDEESPYGEHIIPRLRAELPETALTRVEGFCLGSGYLLLLFPMLALAWFIQIRRRRIKGPVPDHG